MLLALAALSGCASPAPYMRVEDIPETKPSKDEYRVAVGDVIGVRVWNQESMSLERVRVREDGKIAMPFLNDVEVVGNTPGEISERLRVKLLGYVVNPVVTVSVIERPPNRVSVLGEVAHPGQYDLDRSAGLLVAIAAAGGFTPYAHRDRIFVLRHGFWADGNPEPARIRFTYERLAAGKRPAATFRLVPGDIVIVE